MKVKLRNSPTVEDVVALREVHRRLQSLTIGYNPSGNGHSALMAAIFAVRGCLVDWTGDPFADLVGASDRPGDPPRPTRAQPVPDAPIEAQKRG